MVPEKTTNRGQTTRAKYLTGRLWDVRVVDKKFQTIMKSEMEKKKKNLTKKNFKLSKNPEAIQKEGWNIPDISW